MPKGVFITFEGIEGCGKSTQVDMLCEYLEKRGIDFIRVREPGGTAVGERIREILLTPEIKNMDGFTEFLLYLASRNELVKKIIRPALQQGRIVISDRYIDSSVAYQGGGRGIPVKLINRFNNIVVRNEKPHITFLIDIDETKGLKRIKRHDRIEKENMDFHKRVREMYIKIARRSPGRIKIIDGNLSKEEMHKKILQYVNELLKKRGYNEE